MWQLLGWRRVRCVLLIGALTGAGVVVADTAPAPRRLTLAEAYALAESRSETLGLAAAEWRAAEARYRQAVGGHWPELRAEAESTWRDAPGEDDRERTSSLGAGVTYPIFQGFRTTRLVEAREQDQLAAGLELERARQLLYEDVADAFYQTLASVRVVALWGDQVAALQARVEALQGRVAQGRSRKAELLSAQVQEADARAEIAAAAFVRDATLELLAFLTGLPADGMALADTSALPESGAMANALTGLAERPDLRAAVARVEAARAESGAASSDRHVNVTLEGGAAAWTDPDDTPAWDVTLRAELPLFDGGQRRAAAAEAREQVRLSEWRLGEGQRAADRDVRLAHRAVVGALAQWAALDEAVRLADENVAVQRRDYELGRANNLDVLTALVQSHALQRRRVALELGAKAAMVRLHVAAGSMTP